MTATFDSHSFVVFYSKHLDQEICSSDLASYEEEKLQILLLEATKVASECLAGYEWSKSSLPNQWPDEDWPRRVRKKANLVRSFAKAVNSEIKGRRQKSHLEALQLKAEALQLKAEAKAARLTDAESDRYIRMRYIRAALKERFGNEITREVLARAADIAANNKPRLKIASELKPSSHTD